MNIYDAIMKAADHIERYPKNFNFFRTSIPADCGTPGCALGWVMHFSGARWRPNCDAIDGVAAVGVDSTMFYQRMSEISREWADTAQHCVSTLRLYAEKYHGNDRPKPVTVPNWQTIAERPLIPEHVKSEELVS